jgi:hypothetical protein
MVSLPQDVRVLADRGDERRLDQLAQALCGCWVVSLSNGGISRLLGAIMSGDDSRLPHADDQKRRAVSGGGVR